MMRMHRLHEGSYRQDKRKVLGALCQFAAISFMLSNQDGRPSAVGVHTEHHFDQHRNQHEEDSNLPDTAEEDCQNNEGSSPEQNALERHHNAESSNRCQNAHQEEGDREKEEGSNLEHVQMVACFMISWNPMIIWIGGMKFASGPVGLPDKPTNNTIFGNHLSWRIRKQWRVWAIPKTPFGFVQRACPSLFRLLEKTRGPRGLAPSLLYHTVLQLHN
jgi:hypothetical protein